MVKKRRVLLTHYDLDGIGCDILMSNIYDFDKKHTGGYAKIKSKISNGDISGYDFAVITDVSLTEYQFEKISGEYDNRLLYIDHHKPSVKVVGSLYNESNCLVNTKFSATSLVLQTFLDRLHKIPHINKFVIAIDAYDMWRIDSHLNEFKMGYDLNILFWKYGYFDFYDRFFNSLCMDYKIYEKTWISDYKSKRDDVISTADCTEFGENSLLVLDTPNNYVNDFTIQMPDYDLYYMVCSTRDGYLTLSIRSKLNTHIPELSVGMVAKMAKDKFPDTIITAGGHPKSAGIDFVNDININDILNIVEYINTQMETANLIPF